MRENMREQCGKGGCVEASLKNPVALLHGGLLASARPFSRAMLYLVLLLATCSLIFAQLSIIGLGSFETGRIYAVLLLAPVMAASLLFGAVLGGLFGLLAGAVLLLHSHIQPLDFYEVYFITPVSSCVLFAAAGFVAGLLFALLFRGKPAFARSAAGIVAICIAASCATVLAFRQCVLHILATQLMFEGSPAEVADTFGPIWAQVTLDSLLTALVCLVAYAAVLRGARAASTRSLRATFRGWLFAVVAAAFMATAGIGFFVVTIQEERRAFEVMDSEATYLCNQIKDNENRLQSLSGLVGAGASAGQDAAGDNTEYQQLMESFSLDGLLEGYQEDIDGMVMVSKGDTVILSDTESFPTGYKLEDFIGEGAQEYLAAIADLDELTQIVYYDTEAGSREQYMALDVAYLRVAQQDDYTVLIIRPASMVFENRGGVMLWLTLSSLVLLLAVFAASSKLLVRVVARPIDSTNEVLARIAQGDVTARTHEDSSREFASLTQGINTTVSALEDQINKTKENIRRELDAAAAIQEAALPRVFPPFPSIMKFDVYASMQPARQVGGDFYDFFLIGPSDEQQGKLGFLIADVSGKGVPASLFMMAAKTAIRGYMESGMELGEAFENANRKLCDGNDAAMFVTAFAGVLDYGTNKVTFVNAGHNTPLLWRNGAWQLLSQKSGLPLGLFDGMAYKAHQLECGIGDELFLYTDGVTEAMNKDDALYGLERLQGLLEGHYYLHPRQLLELVRADVAAFAQGAEQADDITMLALEVGVPPEITASMVVPADDAQLPVVTDFVHTELDRRLCPVRAQRQLDIALEELFVNVAHYAYPDATPEHPGTVRIFYTYYDEPRSIVVGIADEGIPFDPLAKPDAVTPSNIEDAPIGGLGILMAKKSVDAMTYERVDNVNVVTITKSW